MDERPSEHKRMERVIVELNVQSSSGIAEQEEEEQQLVAALSRRLRHQEVLRARDLCDQRQGVARRLSELLPSLSESDRANAIMVFGQLFGPFGLDADSLNELHKELTAKEDAQALLTRLPGLPLHERVHALDGYAERYSRNSQAFKALHAKVAASDPATAAAVRVGGPSRLASPVLPDLLQIAIPAVSGAVATHVVDVALESLRRRAKRTQSRQTLMLYGPDARVIKEIVVSPSDDPANGAGTGARRFLSRMLSRIRRR